MVKYILMLQMVLCSFVFADDVMTCNDVEQSTNECSMVSDDIKVFDWDSIEELDLMTAWKIALADSPTLDMAKARVMQAQARVTQAYSTYWPRLDVSGSPSRVWLSDNAHDAALMQARFFDPNADVADPEDYYQANLTATWTLFNGFNRKFSAAAARYGSLGSEAAYKETKRLLLSAVAAAYYSAELARENIIIAESDKAFNQRQLDEAKIRREIGTGSLSDELNFQVRVNSAKAALIQAKKDYKIAMIGLAALLGIPDSVFPEELVLAPLEPETKMELDSPIQEDLIEYAQDYRPDVIQSHYLVKQAEAGIGIARSEFLPTINLSASTYGERANSGRFEDDDFGSTVALSVSYNLFAGNASVARLKEAKAQKVEAVRNLENMLINVASEVRNAYAELQSAQEQLVLQRSNASLVQRNRDLVEKEYMAGQASLVRLNSAQNDLTAAQGQLAFALVSLRMAWQNMDTATSEILESFDE